MKRLFAVLLVVALVMGGAFAQLSFNAQVAAELWGTNGFKFVPNMAGANTADDWGHGDSATLFNLGYSADKAGVTADIRPSGDKGLYVHNYSGWFKPLDILKVSLGTNVGVSAFGAESIRWNCLGARAGEVVGAAVELTPVEGLYIGYVLNDCGEDIDKAKMGAAATYSVDGIGTFGVQWTTGGLDGSITVTEDDGSSITTAWKGVYDTGKEDADGNKVWGDNFGINEGTMALGVGGKLTIIDGLSIEPSYTFFMYGDGDYKTVISAKDKNGKDVDLNGPTPAEPWEDKNSNGNNIESYGKNEFFKNMHKVDLYLTWGNGPFSVKLLERLYIRGVDSDLTDGIKDWSNFGNVVKAEVNYAITDAVSANLKAMWAMNAGWGNNDWDGGFGQILNGNTGNKLSLALTVPVAFDAGVTVQPGFLLKYDAEAADDKATWSIPLAVKYSF